MVKRKFILLLALGLAVTPLGFAQDSGSGTPPTNGANASAQQSAAAIVNESSVNRQFVQPIPGGIPGVYPGMAPSPGTCSVFAPQGLPSLTEAILNLMAKKSKLHDAKFDATDPDTTAWDGAIGVITYSALGDLNKEDIVLASGNASGEYLEPDLELFAAGILKLKKYAPGMHRVGVVRCVETESDTSVNGFGLGAGASYTPSSGTSGGGVSFGVSHGTSKSKIKFHVTMYFVGLNNGPTDLVNPLHPHNQAVAPPQAPPPAPTPQVVKVEVEVKSAPVEIPRVAPTPAPPSPPSSDELSKLIVHFAFACHDIHKECVQHNAVADPKWDERGTTNEHVLLELRDWLVQHPKVIIDVIGSADHYNSFDFNAVLSYHRADTVLRYLQKNYPEIASQLFEPDSTSKYHAQPTGDKAQVQEDRTVIFRIHCADSSGK